jgi:heme a synthase
MVQTCHRSIAIWLYIVCFFIGVLVLIGGYTRLTRSGLSITEWNVITGSVPPLTQDAWEEEFAKYQETPEGRIINPSMTLDGYKTIYYVEYLHRLIGRLAGMVYVLPLFYYLARGVIPWRKSVPYLVIGLGFAFQGFLGWYMVASGLVDMPRVSQYRLAAHLITALGLLALTFWVALSQRSPGQPEKLQTGQSASQAGREAVRQFRGPALWLLIVLMLQIMYGAFVAGLKAGHVSNTWPLMFGRFFPPNMFGVVEPWWLNLFAAPATVHFIHRWFAFAVLGLSGWLYYKGRQTNAPRAMLNISLIIFWITAVQITLGVLVVLFNVVISLAIIHQGSAMVLFLAIVYLNYWVMTAPKTATQEEHIAQPSLAR